MSARTAICPVHVYQLLADMRRGRAEPAPADGQRHQQPQRLCPVVRPRKLCAGIPCLAETEGVRQRIHALLRSGRAHVSPRSPNLWLGLEAAAQLHRRQREQNTRPVNVRLAPRHGKSRYRAHFNPLIPAALPQCPGFRTEIKRRTPVPQKFPDFGGENGSTWAREVAR